MNRLPIAAAIATIGLAMAGGVAAQGTTTTGTGTGTQAGSPAAGTAAADQPTTAGAGTGAATGSTAPGPMQGASTPTTGTGATGPGATGTALPGDRDTAQMDRQARADWERRHRASKMIGTNVRDQQGERVGSIEDIVLDRQGNVAYAVISAGGFLGMGESLYAVPWSALDMQSGQDHYVMSVDKERMRQAHGFDKDNWPDMSDAQWQSTNQGFFGQGTQQPGTAPATGQAPMSPTSPATGTAAPTTGAAPAPATTTAPGTAGAAGGTTGSGQTR